jgi:hypothetical protein
MTYCTIVEFEWDESYDHGAFTRSLGNWDDVLPDGCLSRISSIDAAGARVIEVWRSDQDAQAFAEQSKPLLAEVQLPIPSRVNGYQVTSYVVA